MSVVKDFYTEAEFREILDAAAMNANRDWDVNFIDDLQAKFDVHGLQTYLSEAQNRQLKRIAEV